MGGGHGGGGFGGGGGHGGGGFGGWHGGGWHGGGWGWHGGHYHGGYLCFGGGPFGWGYPYWWWPPYDYYDYYDDYGYPPPYGYEYDGAPAYQYGSAPPASLEYDGRDYLQLGHDSGKALRLKTASQDWLVDYLRAYIVGASPSARDDFRRGFISGYGDGGENVWNKVLEEAQRPAPPRSGQSAAGSQSGRPVPASVTPRFPGASEKSVD